MHLAFDFLFVVQVDVLNNVIASELLGCEVPDLCCHAFSNNRSGTVSSDNQIVLVCSWILTTIYSNCSVFTVNLGDIAVLIYFDIRRSNFLGMLECPHDLKMAANVAWSWLFPWHPVALLIFDPVKYIQVVIKNRLASEPLHDRHSLGANVDRVDQVQILLSCILVLVVVERLLVHGYLVALPCQPDGRGDSSGTVANNADIKLPCWLCDKINVLNDRNFFIFLTTFEV